MEYNAWVNQILKRREERESLLSDSDKIDAQVADVAKEYSPSTKKFSMRGADTKVEAVEKGIPDDHPMKGFTPELQDAYRKALADPELIRYKPREILSELAGRFAEPRLEPSMEYKRRADSSLSNLFGLFGEDKSVAFPLSKVHPELYQQWRSAKQMEEAAAPREGAGYLESIGTAAGLTAGIGGLIGALGGPAGAASGAITGGIIGGLAEIPAYPLRQLIRGTEWYKAREASDSTWDKAKLLAADLGVDVVTGAGVYKGIGKAGLGLAKAAERAAGSSASLDRAMADFARVHDAGTAIELWRAARQNAKGQQQVADIMESMTSGPKFKQMVYDVTAEYQDRYRQLQELADPYFFKARRAVTEGLPAEPRSYATVPEMEVVGGSARSGGKILEKRGLGEEVKGPVSGLDLPGRDPREVIKYLDDESMDAVMNSKEPIGKAVLKAFDEQEALRKAKELEGERIRIAEAYKAGRDKEAQRIEASLAAKSVAEQTKIGGKNSKVSEALWKHSGIEQYTGDPLGASKIAKEGKAASKRLGLKEGELAPKEAIQAEIDLNKWYDSIGEDISTRNEPIETFFHTVDDIRNIANRTGNVTLYHGAPTAFAESMVSKTVERWKSADDILRFVAKEYNIPYTELRNKTGSGSLVDSYSEQKVSRVSTAPPEVASRWAKSFPYGEILSELNNNARILIEAKRRGIPFDDMFEIAGNAANSKGIRSMILYADALDLPDKLGKMRKGGSLVALDVDARSIPEYISSQAESAIKAFDEGKLTEEQLIESWNLSYKDIKIHASNIKNARIVKSIEPEYRLNSIDVVMPERNMNPVGTAMKEAPEIIETAPGVFEKQKVVDEKTVSGLKADIEARKKAKDFIAPALGMIASAGLVAAGTVFGPQEAEAGMVSDIVGRMAQGAMKAGKSVESIAKGAVDAGLTARPLPTGALEVGDWKPMEQLRLWKKEVYEGMTSTAQAIKQVPTLSKTILSRLSPRYFDELAYHEMMMPSTQLASASSAIQHNVPEYLQLVKNIMDQHPLANTYKRAIREVNEVMRPFAERYYGDKVAFDVIENDLKEIGKQLKEKAGGKSPAAKNAVSALEARKVALEKAKAELLPSLQAMTGEHAALVEPLARKYATVRVALAAEDTMEFSKYPFLKGMMTRDDAVAAARIKNLMEHFAGRIKGAGEKVITAEPYIHHASHPVSSTVFAQQRLDQLGVGGGLTTPLAKFFSRSEDSLQLFPEINYIMQRYIPDAEKRIQYATFWQKGKKWGWDSHQWNDFVQSTPVLRDYWARIRESLQPPPETFWNKLANRYSTLEVVRLIGFAPSVALKHAFKVSGSMAMAGPSATIRNLPKATVLWAKNMVRQNADRTMIKSLGIDIKNPGALEELAYTYAHNNRMMQNILDYEINTLARGDKGFMSQFDKWTRTLADWGGSLVNAVEQWDRTFNVLIATEMAAKKGLTTEQAIHGILGTTLRNNFLGGPLNPRWLASPVLRSIFIFQGTPFKLWERRFMNAYHTGKAIKSAWGESYKGEGIRGVLNEMAGLKRYIQDGERELKQNLIYDAFNSKRDILGGSMPAQLMKEMLLLGTVMTVGGYLSMDFTPQVLHLPFVKTDRQEPGVTTNPFINSFFKTAAQRREAVKYDEEPDFYVSSFARNWLGKSGVIPAAFHKMMRISDNDIPEIYKDSAMKYFFAVPAKK